MATSALPYNHKDDAYSTFDGASGIALGATSVTVADGTKFNSLGNFPVRIWCISDFAHPTLDPKAENVICNAIAGNLLIIGAVANDHNTVGKTYAVMDALVAAEWVQVSQYPVVNKTPANNTTIPAGYSMFVSRTLELGASITLEIGLGGTVEIG